MLPDILPDDPRERGWRARPPESLPVPRGKSDLEFCPARQTTGNSALPASTQARLFLRRPEAEDYSGFRLRPGLPTKSASSFRKAQHDLHIVIYTTAGNESGEFGGQFPAIQAGDKRSEIEGVRSDISERTARAALRGVSAPESLLLAGLFERRGQPVLRILHLHHANRTQLSLRHHLARLPNHGMAGVVMRDSEKEASTVNQFSQIVCIFESRGERLVANHVDTGFKERLRRRVVQMVRSDDRDRIDPVCPRRFGRSHFRKTAIGPIGRDVKIDRRGARTSWIGRQSSSHQFEAIVKPRGNPMHCADETARAAANHAQAAAFDSISHCSSYLGSQIVLPVDN